MDNRWYNLDEEEEIGMLNGRCVTNALAIKRKETTKNELLQSFIASTDEPQDLVEDELTRILDIGVTDGFIVKLGNKYALPSLENIFEADYDDTNDSESECESQPVDMDMQLIIAQPNRYNANMT